MNFLVENLIYKYNDMAFTLVRGLGFRTGKNYFPYISFTGSDNVDVINNSITFYFLKTFGSILGSNILIILYALLAFYFCYKLFFAVVRDKSISLVFSFFYVFSTYSIYRVISSTFNLYQIFFFPLIMYLLHVKKIKPLYLGLITFGMFVYSSYYAYFSSILIIFWFFAEFIQSNENIEKRIKTLFRKNILFILPIVLLLSLFFSNLLFQHIPFFSKSKNIVNDNFVESSYRPLDDYYNLSFRPWYFFIPPRNSLYFGEFSKELYEKIEATKYYLANDYTEEEAAGSYIGWHFTFGLLFICTLLLLVKLKKLDLEKLPEIKQNKLLLVKLLVIIALILLISHPPSFTVSGKTIYTPSYLVYYLAPVFRTLVRWSVVINLLILIINAVLFKELVNKLYFKGSKFILMLLLLVLNYFVFAIKVPVVNVKSPPQEIAYLASLNETVRIAVFPEATYYSTFWILSHKHALVNPSGISKQFETTDLELFTKTLPSEKSKSILEQLSVNYLIFYPENLSERDLINVTLVNPTLKTPKDIKTFFTQHFGLPVFASPKAIIYKLYDGSF